MTVNNEMEVAIIEGILRAENIPMLPKYREAGGYMDVYMGFSSWGIDIYVSQEDLQRAKDAIHKSEGLPE